MEMTYTRNSDPGCDFITGSSGDEFSRRIREAPNQHPGWRRRNAVMEATLRFDPRALRLPGQATKNVYILRSPPCSFTPPNSAPLGHVPQTRGATIRDCDPGEHWFQSNTVQDGSPMWFLVTTPAMVAEQRALSTRMGQESWIQGEGDPRDDEPLLFPTDSKTDKADRRTQEKMVTVELETTPTPNPTPTEEEKTESNQEVANPEHYIKHPLQNRWAPWIFKNGKSKTWQANLRLISKFDTVEDFWALYNHIQLSSNEKNERGGRCVITLNKQQRPSDLDRFRLATLLCLTGECFDDYSDDVCGAVVNVRAKGEKIAMWTTDCENREAVTHIGRVYKERLGLPPKIVIGYQSHADTATKSSSTTKNRFVV
ncbi:hypothetical protein E2I00_002472 [Balaenoptera physalus]|uniref:Eukaryotic translation initiation factor 4E n=1 Tax=Balaenoptera physalus TaxID=9770 RepID=A0A643CIJ8_BALPH|nr:hypothetical protein E2I00_002472 [Balaenoptera physalus]